MIRRYHPSDKSVVIDIFLQNTPDYFAVEEQLDLEQFLLANGNNYWLIEQDGLIAGCGGIVINEELNEGRIAWDFLSPDFHGQGLGRKLTEFRLTEIRKTPSVQRIVVRTSQLAYQFYAKFGFQTEKIAKDYWAPGLDLYAMQMPA